MHYFVSYSRQELYYAESLVTSLQSHNFDVWFDLQRLSPGSKWQEEISKGLESSDAVILVVSNSSLNSPWVAVEWQHAIDSGKPLHLVLFEAVDFDQLRGEKQIKVDQLPLQAYSITDLRADFDGGVQRLAERLRSGQRACDEIPLPTRYGIELALPKPVAFVNLTMAMLTVTSAVFTAALFTDSILTLLLGVVVTLYLAAETWQFTRRVSYAGTRLVLLTAPVYLLLFGSWMGVFLIPLLLIVFAGIYLVMRSPDIHRRSPPGQGIQQLRSKQSAFGGRRGDRILYIVMVLTALTFIDVLFVIPTLLLQLITSFFQRHLSFNVTGSANATYEILHTTQDQSIAQDIERAMQAGGFQKAQSNQESPDYTLIVVTNYVGVVNLRENMNTIIPILASPLQSTEPVTDLLAYQWVDYRRHDPLLLQQMVQDIIDIRQNTGQRPINSFSTRLIPRDFSQLILPRRVAAMVVYQLFVTQFSIGLGLSEMMTNAGVSAVRVFVGILLLIGGYFFSIYLQNRVIQREITPRRMTNLTFLLTLSGQVIGIILAIIEISSRQDVNLAGFVPVLLQMGIVTLLSYVLLRVGNWIFLRYWLPREDAFGGNFPDFERDSRLWARNLRLAAFTLLFTLSMFGAPTPSVMPALSVQNARYTPYTVGSLSITLPEHWRGVRSVEDPAHVLCEMPISHVLYKAGNPDTAAALNGYFFTRAQAGNTPILHQLGQVIEVIFFRIIANLDSFNGFDWYAQGYGNSIFAAGYTRDTSCSGGSLNRYVLIRVWKISNLSMYGWPDTAEKLRRSLRSTNLKVYVPDNPNPPRGEQSLADYVPTSASDVSSLFSTNHPVYEISPGSFSQVEYVMPVSAGGGEYFVTITGDGQTINEQLPLVRQVLNSIE